jgi:MFS family permease
MSDPTITAADRSEIDASIPAPISSAYANYVLGVLFIVYVFNFVDRQVLSVFIGPIKAEFGASDTQMGLLVGFAFAVLYTFAGIPIARWADRGNRRNIIVLGLTVWSAMTAVCGFSKSYLQLFFARVGVGLGEAAGTPPAHSLISDYFPQHKRATALAIYAAAVHVGAAIAYLGGSYLREHVDWRTAFLVLGVPGMLFALVVRFSVREPPRGYADQRTGTVEPASFMETLRFLLGSRTWVLMITGSAFIALTGYGVMMWGYEFFGRVHKMSPVEIGKWLALIGVGGIVGSLIGGRIADSAFKRKPARMISVPALWTLACVPFGVVSMLADARAVVLTCFAIFSLLLNFYLPAVYSSIQSLAKLQMRATAVAILLFIINMVGAGLGPLLVGGISDFLAPQFGVESIRYALLVVIILGGAGCIFLALSSRYFEQDLRRATR